MILYDYQGVERYYTAEYLRLELATCISRIETTSNWLTRIYYKDKSYSDFTINKESHKQLVAFAETIEAPRAKHILQQEEEKWKENPSTLPMRQIKVETSE